MSPPPPSPAPDPSSNPTPGMRPALLDPSALEMALGTLQQRLDQLQQSLAQQNKLATLGMITAVIAHEFNNILTPMIAYTTFGLGEKADEALRTKALQKALAGAERLSNISKSLLGFTRGDESVSAQVLVAVKDTLSCLARDLSKDGITLTLEIAEDLHVAMNGGQLQQVLMNLIVNARSAMLSPPPQTVKNGEPLSRAEVQALRRGPGGQGGVKRLSVKATPMTGKKGEARVQIVVADTGPGIPAEVLPRIFEPFFSTKKRGEMRPGDGGAELSDVEMMPKGGTGLGLTICSELIAAAGGAISVQSEVGKGTTFVIDLPGAAAPKAKSGS